MDKKDILELRKSWLTDIKEILENELSTSGSERVKKLLRNAEADIFDLTDPERADRHRRINPSF